LALDSIEEADEFEVAVALHTAADHRPVEYAEGGGEQGGGAVPLVVVRHGLAASRLDGSPGGVRSSAWIRLFSSIDSATAWVGGSI
jgi:hypothetical protein